MDLKDIGTCRIHIVYNAFCKSSRRGQGDLLWSHCEDLLLFLWVACTAGRLQKSSRKLAFLGWTLSNMYQPNGYQLVLPLLGWLSCGQLLLSILPSSFQRKMLVWWGQTCIKRLQTPEAVHFESNSFYLVYFEVPAQRTIGPWNFFWNWSFLCGCLLGISWKLKQLRNC